MLIKFVFFVVGILKVNDEIAGSGSGNRIREPDPNPDTNPDTNPDPLVRGMDPRIRIHTKMSWIRNTGK
jgi:hypothetical protein